MKSNVLLGSVVFIAIATVVGVLTALFAYNPLVITRLTTVASIFGLGSIGLFFVGTVFPST